MASPNDIEENAPKRRKWCFGVLNEKSTDEVPGSVVLLSKTSTHNAPLGIDNIPARTSSSSLPPQFLTPLSRQSSRQSTLSRASRSSRKKKTSDGKIILSPQPEESSNDPLNWPFWKRNSALLSLGFYCCIGGGITPLLAAGFTNVAQTFNVPVAKVALTTGLYMLGLGIGGVIMSPTAIKIGKRPVYLATAILFILSSVWCALSPSYGSLIAARIFQGISVSPVEVLPSATVAEIFFLHERAFRLGIYTLLLLSGKNLIPLISAVIIQEAGWRWAFWTIAIIVGFCFVLLFFFLPETYWDRTPRPKAITGGVGNVRKQLVRLASGLRSPSKDVGIPTLSSFQRVSTGHDNTDAVEDRNVVQIANDEQIETEDVGGHSLSHPLSPARHTVEFVLPNDESNENDEKKIETDDIHEPQENNVEVTERFNYTEHWRSEPKKSYLHSLRLFPGKLNHDSWFKIALRPFILFAYPAVLWSALVYALSVGWLIVLSESVSVIYRNRDSYNFTSLQTGLVYMSPFVGSIFGTAVAGKVSDIIVRWMSRRNDGVYEPEFRLVMAIPIALATTIGLMGFGWSAQERDVWIVPTLFFGILSFGASLGSTTAITFCVDSYRQYAGEALVTLNFSKNVFHGMVFSLFFTQWLESDGSKSVFITIGGIHIACMLFSIPMFIFGKRLRMWTARRAWIEKF